jgi:hypothetical protein
MKVLFAAQLLKVASKQDRTYALTFNTRELRGIDAANLLGNLMDEGWLLWSPDETPEETDVPDEKADSMTGTKTQAQRLRGTLWHLWEQGGKKGDFESFYRTQMERFIERVKEQLDG